MHEMSDNFKDVKEKMDRNSVKVEDFSKKIEKMEKTSQKNEKENKKEFELIRKDEV